MIEADRQTAQSKDGHLVIEADRQTAQSKDGHLVIEADRTDSTVKGRALSDRS